jgi:predicted PurR-regulated permease PerM
MHERFQALVSGAILAVIIGWVLYIGKGVFVPVVFSAIVVYVIVGLTRMLQKIPVVGDALSLPVRYALSVVVIVAGITAAVYEIVTYMDILLRHAPQYQEALLAAIQRGATFLHIETEPTWATLRRDVLAQIDIQKLAGSAFTSVTAFAASVVFMFLCASFLLLEQRSLAAKLANLTSDPHHATRIQQIVANINSRVGSYLALKTLLSILLGAISWLIMAFFGLQFAVFWAVLIGLLNYIPYLGSFLGVMLPAAMAIVQFGSMDEILLLLLFLGIAQFLIGNFLDPYVMGNSLNLSPFAILVSLTVWSALWGVAGAFLAVPITAILTIVFSEFAGTRPIAVLLSRSGRL